MSREGYVHLPGIQLNLPGRLRTFWFRRLRRMAPALFRLFNVTTLTTIHITFSMARLSWQYDRIRLAVFPRCPTGFQPRRYQRRRLW